MIDLPPPDPYVEMELASTGISKGLAQTDGPQLEITGGVLLGDFSINAYGKNVETSGDDGIEFGASIGLEQEVAGTELSVNIGFKTLTAADAPDRTAVEIQAEATRSFGPVGVSALIIYSPNDTGSTGQAVFGEAELTWKVADRTEQNAAVGRRQRDGSPDYTAFNVGISHQLLSEVTLDLRYYATDRDEEGEQYRPGVVASVRARF
jgi:uncharacterized protein (TIGR02001 family)